MKPTPISDGPGEPYVGPPAEPSEETTAESSVGPVSEPTAAKEARRQLSTYIKSRDDEVSRTYSSSISQTRKLAMDH